MKISKRELHALTFEEPYTTSKRQKTAVPTYLCTSGDEHKISRQFPNKCPATNCEHLINTCKACLKEWVNVQIETSRTTPTGEDGMLLGIACPECPELMLESDIQGATTKTNLERFQALEYRHTGNNTPGWIWCPDPDCGAGHVPDGKIFMCKDCGERSCVPCDRPYHDGETCAAYQLRIKDRVKEEDKSLEEIKKATKPCPHCGVRVQKRGGCEHMKCHQCGQGFVWKEKE
jgi:hypothetical protein